MRTVIVLHSLPTRHSAPWPRCTSGCLYCSHLLQNITGFFERSGTFCIVWVSNDGKTILKSAKLFDCDGLDEETVERCAERTEESTKMIKREAEIYKHLSPHEGILEPTVTDIGLIFPYLPRTDLRHVLLTETTTPAQRDAWILSAVSTLVYIHSKDVMVSDISTRSILVRDDDTIVICDFAGSALGSLPPDVAAEAGYSMRDEHDKLLDISMLTEVFAIGSLIYEIATGQKPYHELEDQLSIDKLFSAKKFPSLLDVPYAPIIENCWCEGYTDSTEVLEAIKTHLAEAKDQEAPRLGQCLFAFTIIACGILLAGRSLKTARPSQVSVMTYNVHHVKGFFQHDTHPTGPGTGFRATTLLGLGLHNIDYDSDATFSDVGQHAQWRRFLHHLKTINGKSKDVQYKLLVVVRHGEAVHNVKEHEVGRHEWEDHWAKLDGDGNTTWADARLTAKGEAEAKELGRFWSNDMLPRGVPFPQHVYSSPLTRCIQTSLLAHEGLGQSSNTDRSIHVTEALRETIGVHTCDRRSTRSSLQTTFPHAVFDQDFTEEDELWHADRRESPDECAARLGTWLQRLFEQEESHVVLVAAHSGSIRALLRAAGHPDVWPARGSMNPLFLRAEKLPS